jgi:hypothetical protein
MYAAHSLKSDSLAVGAVELGNIAGVLEERGRRGEFAGVADLLERAYDEMSGIRPILKLAVEGS